MPHLPKHKIISLLFLLMAGFAFGQTGMPPKKDSLVILKLFFKPNSLNFDTLSYHNGKKLPISDTNQIINHMVNYIATSPANRCILIQGCADVNEQNQETLSNQRAQKVVNLLIQFGVSKNKIEIRPYQILTNAPNKIQIAKTEKEKEQLLKEEEELHKTKRCVILGKIKVM